MPTPETLHYIKQHKTDDPRRLALQSRPSGVDMPYALEQIAGWQAARLKLPQWAATQGVVYPPHLSMEQCSSEPTARYKRMVAERLMEGGGGESLVDLTGGFGVDFSYMARAFRHATYVERQERLCDVARHNMALLGLPEAEIVCGDGTEHLRQSIGHVSMIFADPARRDDNGGKTFAIADCTPDVAALSDSLVEKADWVMVKLSPMLDWHKAAADLKYVTEVHIVAVRNECKELLLVMRKDAPTKPQRLFCVDFSGQADNGAACHLDELTMEIPPAVAVPTADPTAGMYLYEPNASMMKAGCFGQIARKYGLRQIAPNSHLFLATERLAAFHGRGFHIKAVSSMNKKELRKALEGIDRANVAVRNFPIQAADLRKRLKLKDGGDRYIFATTLSSGTHTIIIAEKAPPPSCVDVSTSTDTA